MVHWYALRVGDALLTADFLREANYVAYAPCERVERRRGRRKDIISRPALPGYVFVLCAPDSFRAVLGIGETEDFIRYTNDAGARVPLRLPADALVPIILAELFGDFDHTRTPKPWEPKRGDAVKIAAGLWSGYVGSILSLGKKKHIIELLFDPRGGKLPGSKAEFVPHEVAPAA